MSDARYADDGFINSIIGEGTRITGELDLSGPLRIDGDFSGVIRTKGQVIVGRTGRAQCTVHAGSVRVGGVLRGEVYSTEKVEILSTGLVLGSITTPRLIVHEGVIFNGSCRVALPAAAEQAAPVPSNGQKGVVGTAPREAVLQGQGR